jgi:hypothetical protein
VTNTTDYFLMTPRQGFAVSTFGVFLALAAAAVLIWWLASKLTPSSDYLKRNWKSHVVVLVLVTLALGYSLTVERVEIKDGNLTFVASVVARYVMPLSDIEGRELVHYHGAPIELIRGKSGKTISIQAGVFPADKMLQFDCVLEQYAPWSGDIDAAAAAGFTSTSKQHQPRC